LRLPEGKKADIYNEMYIVVLLFSWHDWEWCESLIMVIELGQAQRY